MDKQEFLKKYVVERHGTDCMKWDGLEGKFGEGERISGEYGDPIMGRKQVGRRKLGHDPFRHGRFSGEVKASTQDAEGIKKFIADSAE